MAEFIIILINLSLCCYSILKMGCFWRKRLTISYLYLIFISYLYSLFVFSSFCRYRWSCFCKLVLVVGKLVLVVGKLVCKTRKAGWFALVGSHLDQAVHSRTDPDPDVLVWGLFPSCWNHLSVSWCYYHLFRW